MFYSFIESQTNNGFIIWKSSQCCNTLSVESCYRDRIARIPIRIDRCHQWCEQSSVRCFRTHRSIGFRVRCDESANSTSDAQIISGTTNDRPFIESNVSTFYSNYVYFRKMRNKRELVLALFKRQSALWNNLSNSSNSRQFWRYFESISQEFHQIFISYYFWMKSMKSFQIDIKWLQFRRRDQRFLSGIVCRFWSANISPSIASEMYSKANLNLKCGSEFVR